LFSNAIFKAGLMESLVLGLESSCDETAASIVAGGRKVLSGVVASQIELHQKYGGVVPEVASRRHLETFPSLVTEALDKAGLSYDRLTGLAVTSEPGLIGALLTGVSLAKGLALSLNLPLAAVNHLEAHLYASELNSEPVEFPAVGLVISGGHTELYDMERWGKYRLLAATRDDAAGEAFDKVAKLMGLGYPGGPVIERISAPHLKNAGHFPPVRFKDGSHDFSFSGLKTAVRNVVAEKALNDAEKAMLAAKFQNTVVQEVRSRVRMALMTCRPKTLMMGGGVACNGPLREALASEAKAFGVLFRLPPPVFCADNASMVAGLGAHWIAEGRVADLSVSAHPSGSLG
jgi:N6-L-threonylcarbamoyladenine synthase